MNLEQARPPDEQAAQTRAWETVSAAFAQREPIPHRKTSRTPLAIAALTIALAIVASTFSPPGRAVVDRVRRTVGVEHAAPALFSLPTAGRLLVASDQGVWVVEANGKRRLLSGYREASWSPFGRYIVAARSNEIATLTPDGKIRWTLTRPATQFPRWSGTATDTKIAYLTGHRLHVVAGDGTTDLDLFGLRDGRLIAPAWQQGNTFVLAYANRSGQLSVIATKPTGRGWAKPPRSAPIPGVRSLEWSTDGTRLLATTPTKLMLFNQHTGTPLSTRHVPGLVAAALRPDTHQIATIARPHDIAQVTVNDKVVFSCGCTLDGLQWSPNGKWLLVGSPDADQWIFIQPDTNRIVAYSNVSTQFRTHTFPRPEGWCCRPFTKT